jgi:hypothetical protein
LSSTESMPACVARLTSSNATGNWSMLAASCRSFVASRGGTTLTYPKNPGAGGSRGLSLLPSLETAHSRVHRTRSSLTTSQLHPIMAGMERHTPPRTDLVSQLSRFTFNFKVGAHFAFVSGLRWGTTT